MSSPEEDHHVEEEKKSDGGKIKIPAHLMQATQAPAPKPAWMQKLASTKHTGGGSQYPRVTQSDETTSNTTSEEKGALALPYSPTRRRTYKIKTVHVVPPVVSEHSLPDSSSMPVEPPMLPQSPQMSQPQVAPLLKSQLSESLHNLSSLHLEESDQKHSQLNKDLLPSSGSSNTDIFEDKTDDDDDDDDDENDDSVEEENDDDSSQGWEVESSEASLSQDDEKEDIKIAENPALVDPVKIGVVSPSETAPPVPRTLIDPLPVEDTQLPAGVISPPAATQLSATLASNTEQTTTITTAPALVPPASEASTHLEDVAPTPSSVPSFPANTTTTPPPNQPSVPQHPPIDKSTPPHSADEFLLSSSHLPDTTGDMALPRRPSLSTNDKIKSLPSPPSSSSPPPLANPTPTKQLKPLDQGLVDYDADQNHDTNNNNNYINNNKNDDDDDDEDDDWMFPHRHEDDSSWVNPSHPIQPERKQHLTQELNKKSVDLFPENGKVSERLVHLKAIDEEVKLNDFEYDAKVGLIVDPHHLKGDGQTVSETSFSEASKMDLSTKIIESSVPTKEMDIWAMPSQDGVYRAVGKLDSHKDGKDYRFSYIAQPHTHSTSSYADVVRERYFPKEDNDYWAAPVKETVPELPIHISREGTIKSGPSDENESWMPPENDPDQPPVDRKKYYAPTLADEKYAEARSVVTEGSDWMGRGIRTARVDFTGTINEDHTDTFEWNPSREPSPSLNQDNDTDSSGSSEESGTEYEQEIATEGRTSRPRPPSPPATHQDKRAVESAPRGKQTLEHVYDYSPSGRLKFDLTPETIVIEGDVEGGNAKSGGRSGTAKNEQKRCLWYLSLCFFLVMVPAAVACIVVFVVDPFDQQSESSPAGPAEAPTTSPTMAVDDKEQSKAPTPTGSFIPAPSPGQDPSSPSPPIDEDLLVEFLSRISSDDGAALSDPTSPQYAAMQWLRSSANSGIYKDSTFIQRYSLATLYFATGGEQWSDSTAWLTNTSECEWYTSSDLSRICDLEDNLVELSLRTNGLVGSLPAELNLLSNSLSKFSLFVQSLVGNFLVLTDMKQKRTSSASLQLDGNKLTGQLPSELSALWNLERLQLSQNLFRGTIPASIGTMSNLSEYCSVV